MLRRAHRFLGVLLALPLLLWTGTGLLFLVKPGWSGAYEGLSPWRDEPLAPAALVPLAEIPGVGTDTATRIELAVCALGPVYRVRGAEGSKLVDARTGQRLSPLGPEEVRRVARDAVVRARFPERYGELSETREEGQSFVLTFEGGARVRVDRDDLSISQAGPDTARIDALYRVHYLQWTGLPWLDRALELLAIGGAWALVGLGLVLLRRGRGAPPG